MAVLKKLKASTLLETLIAMVVIIVCFGIGLIMYLNVVSSENSSQKLHANIMLQNIASKSCDQKEYLDNEYEIDNLIVKKRISNYGVSGTLLQLSLSAYSENGKLIAHRDEVILVGR